MANPPPYFPPNFHPDFQPDLSRDLVCPDCGALLGREVVRDGARFLRLGGALALHVTMTCAACGRRLRWTAPRHCANPSANPSAT